MMNKLELFEPAMCCNTGVCGPSVNEDLLMMTSAIQALNIRGNSVQPVEQPARIC